MDSSDLNWYSESEFEPQKVPRAFWQDLSIPVKMSDFDHFYGAATSGGVPDGCKYFSERAAPQVGPNGSKVYNKKNFDLVGHPKPKLCPIESTKKGDIIPLWSKGLSFLLFFPHMLIVLVLAPHGLY